MNLATFQPASQRDQHPLVAELRDAIITADRTAPRSLQTALGPSEIGEPCARKLAYRLMDEPRINDDRDPWAAIIGTSVHAWLTGALTSVNHRTGTIRYLTETRVEIRTGLSGSGDLYDVQRATVVDHKGVHVDTPVPTPTGWTTINRLIAGDLVFGSDGAICRVVRTYPTRIDRPCYRVTFTDESSIITDDIQQWIFLVAGTARRKITVSTANAVDLVFSSAKRPQRQLQLPNAGAIQLPDVELPVHPYVFGAWIGDGRSNSGVISKPDTELFEHIESCGYQVSDGHGARKITRTVYGLTTDLRHAGLVWVSEEHRGKSHNRLAGHKAIPSVYLRAGYQQRIALLQGLMDTDGTWNRVRKQAVFTTTDKELAHATAELVRTLGWKVQVFPQQAHGFGLTVTAYHVSFTPFDVNPFRLSRKADLVRMGGSKVARYRVVKSIEPTVTVPTRCIDVDSTDHLYLCGTAMLPVHNCVGPTSLKEYRLNGPSEQYRVQVHGYGKGFRRLGLPVDHVAIAFYPRSSDLSGLYVWSEPYNETIIDTALERHDTLVCLIADLDIEHHTDRYKLIPMTTSHRCNYCPWLKPGPDTGTGCPGNTTRT